MTRQILVALCAIFLCAAVVASFGFGSNPPAASAAVLNLPTDTPTATATPTDTITTTPTDTTTNTPTATNTNTPDPCAVSPQAPPLNQPANDSVYPFSTSSVRVHWSPVDCTTGYRVIITIDTKNGTVVLVKRGLTRKSYLVKNLAFGHTYFWRVASCNAVGCTKSKVRDFIIAPPPTPTPTPMPVGTSTPAAEPPSSLANWQGDSVYLDNHDPVYYFDCTWKWRQMGPLILIIATGFTPGEPVNAFGYEISSGITYYNGNYIAEANGWVRTAVDATAWSDGHFHLYFTGKYSRVTRCGHFDLAR